LILTKMPAKVALVGVSDLAAIFGAQLTSLRQAAI
jgi:hypothetical protein